MKKNKPSSRALFTADTHFGHGSIIRNCARPFADTAEMDRYLIEMWNSVVAPSDTIYFLGDFAYWRLPNTQIAAYFEALHGHKHLIIGNHDHAATRALAWETQDHRAFIKVDGTEIVLDHYAGRTWPKSHHGSIQLFGHSHGRMPGNHQQLDVGVDSWGYMPTTLPEIRARLATLPPFRNEEVVGEEPTP